jgi:hypothetical protein
MDQLLAGDQAVDGLLLLVDEAQSLPVHLVEELRVLTNLVRGGVPRVRLVLAGLPSLEETLAGPELESFSQRLAARCYLGKLTRAETTQYVRAHLAASSIDPDGLIAADAWPALFEATDGVPRLVNQLCDQTLSLAAERDLTKIDRVLVQTAWADLQQLPMPSEMVDDAASPGSAAAGVIEFGSLEPEDAPARDSHPTVAPRTPAPPHVSNVATREVIEVASEEFDVVDPTELDDEPEPVEFVVVEVPNAGSAVARSAEPQPVNAGSKPSQSESAVSAAAARPRRPRVFGGCVPEAIDPFVDQFDEEEMVLENFGALSAVFHSRTPQVENHRNPAISQMLDVAIRTAAETTPRRDETNDEERPSARRRRARERASIRLAVVEDSTNQDAEVAEVPREQDVDAEFAVDNSPRPIRPVERVSERSAASAISLDAEQLCETGEAVLIIEDEPAVVTAASADVRREDYRNLFSRLRHGT